MLYSVSHTVLIQDLIWEVSFYIANKGGIYKQQIFKTNIAPVRASIELSNNTIQDGIIHSHWMRQSLHHEENPMHTSVKEVHLAAPDMRYWVNSLASWYWVRPSLLSSSNCNVVFCDSAVAILLSRSQLRLCSEEVITVSGVLSQNVHAMTVHLTCCGLVIKSHFSSSCCGILHNASHNTSRGVHWRALLTLPPAQRRARTVKNNYCIST